MGRKKAFGKKLAALEVEPAAHGSECPAMEGTWAGLRQPGIWYGHLCSGYNCYYLLSIFYVTKKEEVKIIMVKHYRIGLDEKYEVTKKWSLNDLKMIDGKEADTDNPFFDLHFKKVYSLEAYSCASKYAFARTVNKLNHAYLKKDLQIVNFDSTYINDDSIWSSNNKDCLVLMRICFYAFNLVCLSLCPLPL
uniref:Exocyst complex component 1 like n=2 Tax=Cercopithecinae TaxID=9528 RepID=A0A7N9CN10_MACFA